MSIQARQKLVTGLIQIIQNSDIALALPHRIKAGKAAKIDLIATVYLIGITYALFIHNSTNTNEQRPLTGLTRLIQKGDEKDALVYQPGHNLQGIEQNSQSLRTYGSSGSQIHSGPCHRIDMEKTGALL